MITNNIPDYVLTTFHVFDNILSCRPKDWIALKKLITVTKHGSEGTLNDDGAVAFPLFLVEYKMDKDAAERQLIYSFEGIYSTFAALGLADDFISFAAVVDPSTGILEFKAANYTGVSVSFLFQQCFLDKFCAARESRAHYFANL